MGPTPNVPRSRNTKILSTSLLGGLPLAPPKRSSAVRARPQQRRLTRSVLQQEECSFYNTNCHCEPSICQDFPDAFSQTWRVSSVTVPQFVFLYLIWQLGTIMRRACLSGYGSPTALGATWQTFVNDCNFIGPRFEPVYKYSLTSWWPRNDVTLTVEDANSVPDGRRLWKLLTGVVCSRFSLWWLSFYLAHLISSESMIYVLLQLLQENLIRLCKKLDCKWIICKRQSYLGRQMLNGMFGKKIDTLVAHDKSCANWNWIKNIFDWIFVFIKFNPE